MRQLIGKQWVTAAKKRKNRKKNKQARKQRKVNAGAPIRKAKALAKSILM